jgi:hypothetical protein
MTACSMEAEQIRECRVQSEKVQKVREKTLVNHWVTRALGSSREQPTASLGSYLDARLHSDFIPNSGLRGNGSLKSKLSTVHLLVRDDSPPKVGYCCQIPKVGLKRRSLGLEAPGRKRLDGNPRLAIMEKKRWSWAIRRVSSAPYQ